MFAGPDPNDDPGRPTPGNLSAGRRVTGPPSFRRESAVVRRYLAEFVGTLIFVFGGSMTVLAMGGAGSSSATIAIALSFGLVFLVGVWVVGQYSGGHFNPAATFAFLVDKRLGFTDAVGYRVGQFAGASAGALIILVGFGRAGLAGTVTSYGDAKTSILVEVVLTAVFV